MPCPNDRRARSVTVAFRMTPAQSRWLDEVVAESGMTKQDFIMARLREDGITVVPNRQTCFGSSGESTPAAGSAASSWRPSPGSRASSPSCAVRKPPMS